MPTQIELLKKYNLRIRGHLGQHLLIDPNLQRKIVDLAGEDTKIPVLEIGPGLGALTGELLQRGFKVLAVEKDEKFVAVLRREFEGYGKQLKVIHEDILKVNLENVIASEAKQSCLGVASSPTAPRNDRFFIVGNLPYYITAPILFHLLEHRSRIAGAILMMQKEVAARLLASPGAKDYGRLTLALRYAADIRHHFDVPPSCFTPQPEVASSVLSFRFHAASKLLPKKEERFVFHLIQTAFSQRRKTLANLLTRDPKLKCSREKLNHVFDSLGLELNVRGEALLLKDFITLAEKLK